MRHETRRTRFTAVPFQNVCDESVCPVRFPSVSVDVILVNGMTSRSARDVFCVSVRDVLWESAFRSLLPPLALALRDVELADTAVLVEYPRDSKEVLEGRLGVSLGRDTAPSGVTSSCTSTVAYGQKLRGEAGEWMGGVPRTDQLVTVVRLATPTASFSVPSVPPNVSGVSRSTDMLDPVHVEESTELVTPKTAGSLKLAHRLLLRKFRMSLESAEDGNSMGLTSLFPISPKKNPKFLVRLMRESLRVLNFLMDRKGLMVTLQVAL